MRYLFLFLFLILFSLPIVSQTYTDTLKVAYTQAPPFIIPNKGNLEGVNIWLWEQVAEDLNLSYEMVPMNFSEMLVALEKGEVDVCINPLTITSERSRGMDFTHSFFASNSTIAVARKTSLRKFLDFLGAFFNVNFLRGLFILLFIIFLFGTLAWLFERKKNPDHFRHGPRGIWDGVWWSAVTLTTVGYGDKAPKSKRGKATALLLMFGGLLFISGLTASIASSLTVNELSNNPDGFHEFKDAKVGTIGNSGAYNFLKENFFKDVSTYNGLVPGLRALKDGEIKAFIYDEPIMKYRIHTDPEFKKIELLPIKFDVQFYAFAFSQDKEEVEKIISQKILEIMETAEWEIVLNEFGLSEI
ncbi:transporter substrate-binding domain-containing protein [Aureisphaera galaxeae]|uniref:transporter substrate-binding domain-containing protein n=1 Tax=Aureisphaera galaxeae TaxID=1538023 RepID=UPI0023505CB5|nr:transporter substrate-binding domain-containing protein [Aureisphaera galaxeae]MDC8006321.1 transporter substrate-binding domain-containing protein [Aureisphaera galaxeae]